MQGIELIMFEKYLTKIGRLSSKQPQSVKNQWYTQKFIEVHGSTYDYSKVEYTTSKVKVEILCKEHGNFFQTPNSHLAGMGCPKCSGNNRKTTEECIQDFIQVHGNTYEYSKVKYDGAKTKVEIICKKHGMFLQIPDNHISGYGCPQCQGKNQDTLYILKCLNTCSYKIGITNNLKNRIISIGGSTEYITHILAENPRELEKLLHEKYKDYNVFNPTVKSGGTEFFKLTEAQLEEIKQFMSSVQANYLL